MKNQILAAFLLSAITASAATFTWDGGSTGTSNWSGGGGGTANGKNNWIGDQVPANDGTADIIFAGSVRTTPNMSASWSINSLSFASGASAFTLSGSAGTTLTIGTGGAVNNTIGVNQVVSIGNLALGADQTWNALSANLTFSGASLNLGTYTLTADGANNTSIGNAISGTGGITKVGAGTLTISGANTYSGATAVSAGTLRAGAANAFSVNSAFNVGASGTADMNNFNQSVGSLAGSGTVNLGSASLTAGGDNTSTVFAGSLNGSGNLTKTGAGNLELSGNLSHGGSTINQGTLTISGTHSGGVTVNGGKLVGSGTVGGQVTLNSGATISGGNTGVGQLNVGSSIWGGGANLDVDMTSATGTAGADWDFVNMTGGLALTASSGNLFNINLNGTPSGFDGANNYSWLIARANGGITGFDPGAFNVSTNGLGVDTAGGTFFLTLANGNQDLFLNFAAVPEPSTIALGVVGTLALLGKSIRSRFQRKQ